MSKYIIKNCPMYFHNNCCGHTGNCKCQDCTDCVMKQIVELCKNLDYRSKDLYDLGKTNMALNILSLLDIQEVE